MSKFPSIVSAVLAVGLISTPAFAQVTVDPNLPDYTPVQGVSGNIKSIGSDTMNNMMSLWAEGFKGMYPNVRVEIEGKGSSTAPPALISATANFGPMSRAIKNKESDAFEKRFGYKPTQLPTSIDMMAIYVNKDNPITGMSLPQVDAIFSKSRKLGYDTAINQWGQVGLTGVWAKQPISLYGRNSASGTYGYFKKHVLGKGDYRDSVKEQPGSSAVVQGIASDKYGIGYSGIGYKTADVKAISLSREHGGELIPATPNHAYTGDYPLSRFLLLAINYKPGSQLDPLRKEFIKYIFSKQGQLDVVKDGYYPITAQIAKEVLASLNIRD